ncbi:MAG: response regulator [Candidatus Moranbacteria bacterium]|jgi:DNA-binding response OmpR family regulator|nr:response regulator [Candidatus Moranbacteria bacterium]MDQ5961176.1 two-component system, OmpR family, response regulator RpaB [Patescibacteria group bacterium]
MSDELAQLVCIIDDDANIRDIYQRKFLQSGYDVISGANGEEGLKAIRERKPDIILLDIQMPIKDGIEVIKELQADVDLRRIPVIILSNVDDEVMYKKIGNLDATKFYLVKSLVTPQKVVDTVEEVLQ